MAAFSLPVEVLRGLYLGILTGVLPALLAFAFGFGFRYITGITIPAFAVVVLSLALAGVNGGLLALVDPTITQSANSVALMTAVVVVLMLSLYTHSLGDALAERVPHRLSLRGVSARTVSADVVELVGGFGQVAVEVVGEVRDMEGYPPLADDLRDRLSTVEWRFPADLLIGELESRMAERYRSEFDLQAVDVTLDERGRAIVVAAPPSSGVSGRLESGTRAVSLDALVPTGVARGDTATVLAGDRAVDGVIVSARSEGGSAPERHAPAADASGESETDSPTTPVRPSAAPTTAGGRGRITVAVDPTDAQGLLAADEAAVVVTSRGSRREFEVLSLLRRAGQRVRRLTVREGGPLDGVTLAASGIREEYGVAVLALRDDDRWHIGPRGDREVVGGHEVYAVGTREGLDRFQEAVA